MSMLVECCCLVLADRDEVAAGGLCCCKWVDTCCKSTRNKGVKNRAERDVWSWGWAFLHRSSSSCVSMEVLVKRSDRLPVLHLRNNHQP